MPQGASASRPSRRWCARPGLVASSDEVAESQAHTPSVRLLLLGSSAELLPQSSPCRQFGLVTREREPKPALSAVAAAYARLPFPPDLPWPNITLAVCTHNNAATLMGTCEALAKVLHTGHVCFLPSATLGRFAEHPALLHKAARVPYAWTVSGLLPWPRMRCFLPL